MESDASDPPQLELLCLLRHLRSLSFKGTARFELICMKRDIIFILQLEKSKRLKKTLVLDNPHIL